MATSTDVDVTILAGRSRRFQDFINSMKPNDPKRREIEQHERAYIKELLERTWFEENIYRELFIGITDAAPSEQAHQHELPVEELIDDQELTFTN